MIAESFKQQCPTCESMVLIKHAGFVGTKMECPNCKDHFVVASPATNDSVDESSDNLVLSAASTKPARKAKSAGTKSKVEDEEEITEAEPDDDEEAKKPAKKTAAKKNALVKADEEEEEITEAEPDDEEEITEAEPDDDEEEASKPTKKSAAKKKAKTKAGDEEEEITEAEPDDEEEATKPAKKGAAKAKSAAGKEDDDDAAPKKKRFSLGLKFSKFNLKKFGSKKTAIGASLALVGVVVLSWAAYLMVFGGSAPAKQGVNNSGPGGITKKDPPKPSVLPPKDQVPKPPVPPPIKKEPYPPADLDALVKLLPADTEQVVHINFKDLFSDRAGPFYDAAFQAAGLKFPGPFKENDLTNYLGFPLLRIDELLMAECFTEPWSFTVVHMLDVFDTARLTKILGLQLVRDAKLKPAKKKENGEKEKEKDLKDKEVKEKEQKDKDQKAKDQKNKERKDKAPPLNLDYYRVGASGWLAELGRVAPGVPPHVRQAMIRRQARPLFLHLRDKQTLIIADEKPMIAYLEEELRRAENPDPKEPALLQSELKNMLERLLRPKGGWDKNLFASATLMENAMLPRKNGDVVQYRPRPFWDITALMEETYPRMTILGVALVTQTEQMYQALQYRTEVKCHKSEDAIGLKTDLEGPAGRAIGLVERLLGIRFERDPAKIRTGISSFQAKRTDSTASFVLEMYQQKQKKGPRGLADYLALLMMDAHVELAFAKTPSLRHLLSQEAQRMVVTPQPLWRKHAGTKEADQYPPGAFPLALKKKDALPIDSSERISWMAALLPYIEHQKLYDRIDFNSRWFDLNNGPAGRILVPHFIDPSYPEWTRYYQHPDFDQLYGATHYVGIAGVGLDAGDLASGTRRGILGYESSARISQVQKGRGTGNAILMMQVPYDNLPPSPWIAGGGYTLRGVPESQSILPFVSKDGKGTYALMADGSVRFISRDISDKVLQTMCSIEPADPDFDLKSEKNATLVKPPLGKPK